jgi:hypothetical protein
MRETHAIFGLYLCASQYMKDKFSNFDGVIIGTSGAAKGNKSLPIVAVKIFFEINYIKWSQVRRLYVFFS